MMDEGNDERLMGSQRLGGQALVDGLASKGNAYEDQKELGADPQGFGLLLYLAR